MTQIERRQVRLCRIQAWYQGTKPLKEDTASSPEVHHIIGQSQNFPQNIHLFLQQNEGDPAIKVMYF
jgi:hypothetical protein